MADETRLKDLLLEWEELQAEGRGESSETLCQRHGCPELVQELEHRIRELESISSKLATTDSEGAEAAPGRLKPGTIFGDYELIEQIAHGGMGVVYKARQRGLNRIVALKMIRSGQFASDHEVRRFRTEAEAAAGLQHPNIVAIHEVGERDGLHYFSMDYVEGTSLAEMVRESPLPGERAARYVKTVAEAIQYAHDRGILHRDLKPSNVLIDTHYQPRVTDFGLAKRVEGNSELTGTGQILGTPSYMPPEQASGAKGQIGPATDVYSLGATLYDLLTGRPPFRADTPIDTVRQVLETDPVSLRLLNPKLDRDLETITLKCLQKEPAKRYRSARELAGDLGRYLNHEPILARPLSGPERLWRWSRRHPAAASAVAAVLVGLLSVSILSAALWNSNTDLRLANERERQARGHEEAARRQEERARQQAEQAEQVANGQRERAETAEREARAELDFLVGLFQTSDPIGFNGSGFRARGESGSAITAAELLKRGLVKIRDQLKDQPLSQAALMDTMGDVCRNLGLYPEANELLDRALVVRRENNAPDADIAASLHSLAWLRHDSGDLPGAEALARESLAIRQRLFGDDHEFVDSTRFNLAWVLADRKKFHEAEALFRKALDYRSARHTKESREVAMVKSGLGVCPRIQKR